MECVLAEKNKRDGRGAEMFQMGEQWGEGMRLSWVRECVGGVE